MLCNEETDEDLQIIFAPGSSLGGARPKASVIDQHGCLSIAKFPKETDDYSIETWEEVALRLAERAGIATARHELLHVAGKAVLLSRRFDREESRRIPFLSTMAMMGMKDGNHGFLRTDKSGWVLSPAYDINPVPVDLKARVLTTNIDLEEGTCSVDLLESAAGYFALSLADARSILGQVADATSRWRAAAREVGAASTEIDRMASAFEHDDLRHALAFS